MAKTEVPVYQPHLSKLIIFQPLIQLWNNHRQTRTPNVHGIRIIIHLGKMQCDVHCGRCQSWTHQTENCQEEIVCKICANLNASIASKRITSAMLSPPIINPLTAGVWSKETATKFNVAILPSHYSSLMTFLDRIKLYHLLLQSNSEFSNSNTLPTISLDHQLSLSH